MLRLTAAFLVTFWAGSLWTICGMIAPSLFSLLKDRHQAGQLAAHFFHLEAFIGAAIGLMLLALESCSKSAMGTGRVRVLIAITAAMPLISQFALGPLIRSARVAGDMTRVGMLHGAAAALFLIACISALLLWWQFNRRAE